MNNVNREFYERLPFTDILKLRSIVVDPSSDTLRISVKNSLWVKNRSAAGSDFGTAREEKIEEKKNDVA